MLKFASFPDNTDHVVPIQIDGEVRAQDFSSVLSDIEKRLENHDKLRLYIEIKSLGGMRASTVFNELKEAVKHWDRFDKMAIVTDVDGVRTATTVIDKLAPKLECKTYRFDDSDSARLWVID